jgi:1,3-beta-glucanosyltransferase GAS1
MEVLAHPLVRTGLPVPTELCHPAMEASDILVMEITSLIVLVASKLTWIFSQFYLATNDNPQSCDFTGNATVNSASPTTAADVNAAVTSCFAATPAVYTPLTPTTTLAPGAHTGGSTPRSSGGSTGGAVSIFADRMALVGVIVASLCVLGGGAMLA